MVTTKSDRHSAPHMTVIEGCPDRADHLRAGMAHFVGSGPPGQTCGDCKNIDGVITKGESKTRCAKFKELTGRQGETISPRYPCCRYFEAAPKKPPIVPRKQGVGISAAEAELLRTLNNRRPPHLK